MSLVYIIRVALVLEDGKEDPPFGDEGTKYISIDMEMIARTPILSEDAYIYGEEPDKLETQGPFVLTFPTDAKKVWATLLSCLASQVRGNTSRSLQTSRTGVNPGVPSMTISLAGMR